MKKTRNIYLDRFEKFISDVYFIDWNIKHKVYPQTQPVDGLYFYSVPNLERKLFDEVVKQEEFAALPVAERTKKSFGPTWSTHWFKVEIIIPAEYVGKEVHFLWNSNTEAMIYAEDGTPLQGLTGGSGHDKRHEFILTREAKSGDKRTLYVEMACNGMFGAGKEGFINPPNPNMTYNLSRCDIAVFDRLAYDLLMDFTVIYEMAKEMPEESNRGRQALYAANDMINKYDPDDREAWPVCRKIAAKFFSDVNGSSQHQVHAVGHCHIDVGWLWPYGETRRKSARSWASQVLYMDDYPGFTFAQSQAQLYDWVKSDYPKLFEKIKEKVAAKQFIPVGGTWVEMCGILPGGEAMIRQFLYGQRFFKKEFGVYCTEFWLPDSFGYSGQLPQIMLGSKIESFVTQKLSWNIINKFPHSTLMWEGIDKKSKIIAHFPPQDTYCSHMEVKQLLYNVSNFKDKERCNTSLALYGFGDGGGGPHRDHIARIQRAKNVDGLPKVEFASPKQYFDKAREEHKEKELMTWEGELYFELHRGTYTSQASTKKGNRKGEFLLRDLEILSLLASNVAGYSYPAEAIETLWKKLMLNQFHDVLPGSSIKLVYDDALRIYDEIQQQGTTLRDGAVGAITSAQQDTATVFNALAWSRQEVVELPAGATSVQKSHTGAALGVVNAPAAGFKKNNTATWSTADAAVSIKEDAEKNVIIMENNYVIVTIDKQSATMTVFDKRANRYAVKGGNQFILYDDVPLYWDAWDVEVYHLEKAKPVTAKTAKISIVENGPLRVAVEICLQLTKTSKSRQIISLTGLSPRIDFDNEIEWLKESHKMLKVQFPTTIRSPAATYEIQFGHLQRPTHYNTSWDVAKFEGHAQKWADLSEFNYGVSILNDCKYGYAIHENVMHLSLLRSPKAPDDECDMGTHRFKYAVLPHQGTFQAAGVIQEAYNLNSPLLVAAGAPKVDEFSLISVEGASNIIVEAVKRAEDDPNSIIFRVYEAFGGYVSNFKVKLSTSLNVKWVARCDNLEDETEQVSPLLINGTELNLGEMHPFEIASYKVTLQ